MTNPKTRNASPLSRRRLLTSAVVLAALAGSRTSAEAGKSRRPALPNVVLILADDLGYGSLSSYGADKKLLETPRIDRLAQEGRRFTDACTPSSVCSPTRYGLLTGRYVWRTGERSSVYSVMDPLKIEPARYTIAAMMKSKGYATAAFGKWHLGFGNQPRVDYTRPLRPGPLDLGFDHDFLIPQNHGDVTGVFVEDDKVAGLRSTELRPVGTSHYGSPFLGLDAPQRRDANVMEILTDKVVDWISKTPADKPFFVYYSPVAVHEPVTPSAGTAGKSGCGPYCDFIMDLDTSVGRILDELDRRGLAEDTLVLFTSDNGGEMGKTRDGTQMKAIESGLAMNGRWREGKHGIYEGGLRVPYIVRWPGKSPPGSVSDQTVNLVDTMATLAALIGSHLPPETVAAEDSVNVLPAWLGTMTGPVRRGMMVNSEDGVFAIRQGRWKWIEGQPDPGQKFGPNHRRAGEHQPQLYDLDNDPTESRNVIGLHPEVVSELSRLLDQCRYGGHSRTLLTAPNARTDPKR
jgi:arylsulfatase A-like enzyme